MNLSQVVNDFLTVKFDMIPVNHIALGHSL
jgi:hypothetical protein